MEACRLYPTVVIAPPPRDLKPLQAETEIKDMENYDCYIQAEQQSIS